MHKNDNTWISKLSECFSLTSYNLFFRRYQEAGRKWDKPI